MFTRITHALIFPTYLGPLVFQATRRERHMKYSFRMRISECAGLPVISTRFVENGGDMKHPKEYLAYLVRSPN